VSRNGRARGSKWARPGLHPRTNGFWGRALGGQRVPGPGGTPAWRGTGEGDEGVRGSPAPTPDPRVWCSLSSEAPFKGSALGRGGPLRMVFILDN